jgi:hypothetical protein
MQWLTDEEMAKYTAMITLLQLGPGLQGVFGFVDGLNLAIQELPAGALQNTYYNGWLGGCFCSSLFCFALHSTIIWCTLNYLGSWADSELAKLLETLPEGMAIAADCAFNCADMAGKIIWQLKSYEVARYSTSISVHQFIAHVLSHHLALSF